MSREIRRVPMDWQHPRYFNPYRECVDFLPLYGTRFEDAMQDFRDHPDWFDGHPPRLVDYMPDFAGRDDLGWCMYETCTEGTPISPVFATPEGVARWLADNGASSFGSQTATYEQWLRVCYGGYAPSMVYTPESGLVSGVEAGQ